MSERGLARAHAGAALPEPQHEPPRRDADVDVDVDVDHIAPDRPRDHLKAALKDVAWRVRPVVRELDREL